MLKTLGCLPAIFFLNFELKSFQLWNYWHLLKNYYY